MKTDSDVLACIDAAFASVSKPEHFTNFTHCEECAEHDELLRKRDRDSLQIGDVGNPGWDPLCFSSSEGIAYYMPALARLALAPPTREYRWYGGQLLFHLFSGARHNAFYNFCDATQREAVAHLLAHFVTLRADLEKDGYLCDEDDLLRAYEIWSGPSA